MEFLTVKEYAKRSNLPVATIRRLCKENVLPAIKIGVAWRIDGIEADLVLKRKIAERQTTTIYIGKELKRPKPLPVGYLEKLKAL